MSKRDKRIVYLTKVISNTKYTQEDNELALKDLNVKRRKFKKIMNKVELLRRSLKER